MENSLLTCCGIHNPTITNHETIFLTRIGQIKESSFNTLHGLDEILLEYIDY